MSGAGHADRSAGHGEERLRRERRLAEAALDGYGLRDARLQLLRQEFVQVFRAVSRSCGEFVLRLYIPPRSGEEACGLGPRSSTSGRLRSPEVLLSQASWLSALGRETGLLVPKPVPTSDGSLVGHVSFERLPLRRALLRRAWRKYRDAFPPDHPGRHCVLLRWVSGEQKEDLTLREASRLGSFVARMHRYSERYPVPADATLPRWDWEWPFGDSAPLWNEGRTFYSEARMAVFEETARRVRKDLGSLGYGSDVFGVVHRDLNLRNLVFREGEVGAIDFDLCGMGHYLLDLATTRASVTQRASHPARAGRPP